VTGEVVVRSLNDEGLSLFASISWTTDGIPAEPPSHILHDDEYSQPHVFHDGKTRSIDPESTFGSHLDLARTIDSCLGPHGHSSQLKGERGLWSWFSLLFYDQLREKKGDMWKKAAMPRFIPSGQGNSYYRHNVFAPYHTLTTHGADKGAAFLEAAKKTTVWPEINEQMLSTSGIASSKSIVAAVTRLYYDESTKKLKAGASSKDGEGPYKGDGSSRRLRTVFWQLYETYDLRSMTPEQILDVLPAEFDHFKQEADSE